MEMAKKKLSTSECRNLKKFIQERGEDFKKKDALFLLKAVKEIA
jgi:hypothetical protein